MLNSTEILGVKVATNSEKEILEYIEKILSKPKRSRGKTVIFTPNPEQISQAYSSSSLKAILNQAQIALPDGVWVPIAARILGKPIRGRIAGVDFMKNLVKSVSERPIKTGYFGGQPRVAEEAALCLQKSYPKLTISYTSDIYDKQKMIQSDIDILFVGLGFPKQEKWILEHKDEIPASIIMAVGGSFDFLSGRVARAPKLMRDLGLEWLFRLIIQPWRFKRQLRIWHFAGLVILKALTGRGK